MFITTPYLDEAERSSRVGLLSRGRLMAAQTPSYLRSRMNGDFFEILCDDARRAASVLRQSAPPSLLGVNTYGDRLRVKIEKGKSCTEVCRAIRQKGILIHSHRQTSPNLEDVYLEMTKEEAQ
jgi:ABC-2 type transport system ATP-binding protein